MKKYIFLTECPVQLQNQVQSQVKFKVQSISIQYNQMKQSKKSLIKCINSFKTSPKSQNSLSTGKFINNQMSSNQSYQPCLTHTTQNISHFCQNCQYRPVCGFCLQQGHHKNHSVKNIEKTSKIVNRIFTQTLISIRAKSDLLQILSQHIQARKQQINNQLIQYIDSINQLFQSIQMCLQQKKQSIIKTVKTFYKDQSTKISQAEKSCKQENQKFNSMIQILSEKVQRLQPTNLCLYFYQKKQTLQNTLQDGNKVYEQIKSLVPDLKWAINTQIFETVKLNIGNIRINQKNNQIQTCSTIVSPHRLKQKVQNNSKNKIKQRSFKKMQLNSKQLKSCNISSGFWTPKNITSSNNNKIAQKLSKELKEFKIQSLLSSQSLEKLNNKNIQTGLLLKKGKAKEKFMKIS